jgi:hypothetical protein
MRFFLMLAALLLQANTASAYTVGNFDGQPLDPAKETHIFAVGYGKDMGTQFLQNAVTTARRLQEVYPQRQFLFLVTPEPSYRGTSAEKAQENMSASIKRYGIKVLSHDLKPLLGASLVNEILDFRKIASLELFSHGHAVYGAALVGQEPSERFWQGTPGLAKLRGAFTKFGYVIFHGCNAGFVAGPQVSKVLQVPVAGHLTGSNFQNPFEDGQWYFNDKGRYPEDSKSSPVAKTSYSAEAPCGSFGACARLVAEPFSYNGDFGKYKVGLGFRKFYCAYNNPGPECYGAMAVGLLGYPSLKPLTLKSSLADYSANAKDVLCASVDKSAQKTSAEKIQLRQSCFAALDAALKGGSQEIDFFGGNEPVCGLDGCKIKANCNGRQCSIDAEDGVTSTTNMAEEYKMLIKGYQALGMGPRNPAPTVNPTPFAQAIAARAEMVRQMQEAAPAPAPEKLDSTSNRSVKKKSAVRKSIAKKKSKKKRGSRRRVASSYYYY